MFTYYTCILAVSWMTLGILCILVWENQRLPLADRKIFYLTCVLVGVSALAEWLGVLLNGQLDSPVWLLRIVKCFDYVLTPMAGGAFVAQMRLKNRWDKVLTGVLVFNTVLQVVTIFTGGMVTIDEAHRYAHGPLYPVYMAADAAVILLVVIQFVQFGKSFPRQNRFSLYAIMVLIVTGIVMQEVAGSDCRVSYVTLTLALSLMFIHYFEFSQQAVDAHLQQQQIQISTDALTGLLSRHAYSAALNEFKEAGPLPTDLIAYSIDINGLKNANDTLGHEAGDELIRGAAQCISGAFPPPARCFRTGGDEFIVLGYGDRDAADAAMSALQAAAAAWHGEAVHTLNLATGCAFASEHPDYTVEKLIKEADMGMYAAKSAYYRATGHDRRRR